MKKNKPIFQRIFGIWFILFVSPFALVNSEGIRISGSNRAEYWVFVDRQLDTLNYKEHLEDKLKLTADYRDIGLKGILFFWEPSLPNLARLAYFDYTAYYRREPVNILYGRYYATFGRGLVLNQFQNEDFRIDNSLFGIKTEIKYDKARLTLLAGKPRNLFFEENSYKIKNDTTDQIRGADFETPLPGATLGGRYVRVNRVVDLTPKAFTELFGANISLKRGPFEIYFEYARHWGCYPVIGGRLKGEGILFTVGLAFSGLGLSCQFFDYDTIGFGGAGYRYNEPPTPLKSGISVNQGIDETGYGIALFYAPFEIITIELDHNKITTHDTSLNKLGQLISINEKMAGVFEQVAKIKTAPTYNLEISGGIERLVKQKIELPVDKKIETKPNLGTTYNFGAFFVESGYEHNLILCDTSKYYEHAFSIAVGRAGVFIFSVRYERRNRTPAWLVAKLTTERHWPLAELSLDLTNRHNLRIRVGAEKGGLVCSGGVCRFEEPFKGVKAVLTTLL